MDEGSRGSDRRARRSTPDDVDRRFDGPTTLQRDDVRWGPPAALLSARAAQRHQIMPQLIGRALHAVERVAGNLALCRARAKAALELADRPARSSEHRLLTTLLPIREGLLGLLGLCLGPREDPAQPVAQRARRDGRLHGLDQFVKPTIDGWEGGGLRATRGRSTELVCADIARGDAIVVAIHRTGKAALVGGRRRTVAAARVDRRAAWQECVGRGGATVVLQRTELRVHVDEVPGARKAAGVAAVQVVPLGSRGAAAGTVVPRRTVR